MYLDGVETSVDSPVFGIAHTGVSTDSFEDLLSEGNLSAITMTAVDSGSTRSDIDSATEVKFVVSLSSEDVDINGHVEMIQDAFGETHYSVVFLAS